MAQLHERCGAILASPRTDSSPYAFPTFHLYSKTHYLIPALLFIYSQNACFLYTKWTENMYYAM